MKSYSVCLILVPLMFGLAGCPDSGGSSAKLPDPSLGVIEDTVTDEIEETPVLQFAELNGKTLSLGSESLVFTASSVQDTKCGGVYNISQATSLNGVVTLVGRIDSNSFVQPVNSDCMIDVQLTLFAIRSNMNCQHSQMDAQIYSEYVTFTITRATDGFNVSRALSSRVFERNCAYQLPASAETDSVATEVYRE